MLLFKCASVLDIQTNNYLETVYYMNKIVRHINKGANSGKIKLECIQNCLIG